VAAAVTAMLFWCFPYVVSWSALLRIDLLALACSTAGLYLLARWPEARWSFLASAGCLVGAVLTRQSYALAAPAAAFIWLWAQHRRRALSYAALVGGPCLILLVALNVLTRAGCSTTSSRRT
jgi:4-amino-4-deoxy-L-arabinose transferase-like glycosyltransferase